jgi:hypothetical protein
VREATIDGIVGSMLYALLGQGIKSALPSNVSYPGALARMSMHANGANYATARRRSRVQDSRFRV